MGEEASDLITRLLCVDERERLGCDDEVGDYQSIKQHPWFEAIDWDAISKKEVRPPYVPQLDND